MQRPPRQSPIPFHQGFAVLLFVMARSGCSTSVQGALARSRTLAIFAAGSAVDVRKTSVNEARCSPFSGFPIAPSQTAL